MMDQPTYLHFDKNDYDWKAGMDYRRYPEAYRVGKCEQGVLICEPCKSEIGRHWRFKSSNIAQQSSKKIYQLFLNYLVANDFVGADMARKYLQMGYTRARRYANYKGGIKYDKGNQYHQLERGTGDLEKAAAASIFYERWKMAEANPVYAKLKKQWKSERG